MFFVIASDLLNLVCVFTFLLGLRSVSSTVGAAVSTHRSHSYSSFQQQRLYFSGKGANVSVLKRFCIILCVLTHNLDIYSQRDAAFYPEDWRNHVGQFRELSG